MISEVRAAAVAWCRDDALPLWHRQGWDAVHGGFIERFDAKGRTDATSPRRMRVAARQVYVYAHAALLDWYPEAKPLALQGFDRLIETYLAPDGQGFFLLADDHGRPLDRRKEAYEQAFGLLALAWIHRLTGDAQIRRLIDQVLAFADSELMDERTGAWREGVPDSMPRRQNPQMHAFEAMLALYEATGDPTMLARADRFAALAQSRLIDPRDARLFEFFDEDMNAVTDGELAQIWPGHHFEWVWLLHAHARLAAKPMPAIARRLHDWGVAHGLGPTGFAIDECNPDGSVRVGSSRLWPQTECIKAHLALEEAGDPQAGAAADAMLEKLMGRYFVEQPRGAWIDRIDADGRTTDGNMPASSFYHIFCCIAEADRVARKS